MSFFSEWSTLREQCCDADIYLEEGARCAAGEGCYEELRPLGSGLWFGAVDALGLPPGALIWLHGLLLLLSVWLSLRVAMRWLPAQPAYWRRVVSRIGCGLLSLLAHWVFLWPVLPHSLADPPAALLMLIALWMILLSSPTSAWWWHALIGVLFGLSAFVRAYYLYPVIGWLALSLLFWSLDQRRRWRELLVTLALVPILVQFVATWHETGVVSYIDPVQSEKWTELHLRDGSMGYDTLLQPIEAYRWPSPCSEENSGPLQAFEQRDVALAACIFASRLHFYFGSYAATTYLKPDKNVLDRFDDVDLVGGIEMIATAVSLKADRSPDGRHSASRLSVLTAGGSVGLQQAFRPKFAGSYSYSVWLWSSQPAEVELQFYRRSDGELISTQRQRLEPQAKRFTVSGTPLDASVHVIFVGRKLDSPADWGRQAGDNMLLWGGKLERGEQPLNWKPASDPRLGEAKRIWSPLIWVAHSFAAGVLVVLLFIHWRALTRREWAALLLLGLLLAEGLVVIPEQRFLIVLNIMTWSLFSFATVALLTRSKPGNSRKPQLA